MSSFGRFGKSEDHAVREFTICIKPLDGKIHARKRALTVKSWSTVKDLKDILQILLHLPAASQRLFFRGGELRNPHTLQDCGIYRDGQTVYLASSPQDEMGKPYSLEPFLGAGGLPRSLSRVLGQARRGLDRGFKPELTLEGTGGTYFLQDAARQKVAVFKPQDEEPFAPNNPREAMQGGLGGGAVSMRPGIDAGESYVREVAAYILDDLHLHGVPATTLVEAKHPAFCYWDHKERKKLGSFQEFVRHDMVVEDISPSRLTPREVQKIALLDMRILNRDRNSVNILVRSRPRRSCSFSERTRQAGGGRHIRHDSSDGSMGQPAAAAAASGSGGGAGPNPGVGATPGGSYRGGGGDGGEGGGGGARRLARFQEGKTEYELIPIDHGLCLSDELVIDWCDWCWLNWRQVKEPIDPELYNYIQSFNPEETAEKLGDTLNIPESCLKNLRIAETLLKEGVAVGLTLFDIACIIRREDFDQVSELETVVARANELARAAVDHQTSVAPSKHTLSLASKSLDSSKKSRPRQTSSAGGGSGGRSDSLDLTAEDKKGWLDAAKAEEEEALAAAAAAGQAPTKQPALYAHESSTDASSEDVPTLSDLRISADSMDGSGGEGFEGARPLRIWAPPPGTASSRSRESPSTQVAFLTGLGGGGLGSPPQSAESDTELASPVGFWREKFETIDARNASRCFSGWEDNSSVEGVSPKLGKAVGGRCSSGGSGSGSGGGGGGGGGGPGWQGSGRPPLIVGDHAATGGALATGGAAAGVTASVSAAASSVSIASPEENTDSAREDLGVARVGRKLFSSPEKNRPSLVVKAPAGAMSAALEPMAEGDHESPLPGGSQSGEPQSPSDARPPLPTPPPFWVTSAEAAKEKSGAGGCPDDKEAAGGLGWRRGDAGLVVPEPLPPKPRTVTIQQVVPQRVARIGDAPGGGREAKRPLGGPRPATTSPTLPMGGEQKSKMPKEMQVLTPGVKIVRSYSYHGLGSMALYDSARGSARYSLRKRPNENSEQFKACFFRFLRFLLRDLVKRRHRSIVRERGARAARQAAEKSFKSSGATAAAAAAAATDSNGGGGGGRGGKAGDYDADDRFRRRPQPPPPASARNASSRSGMPAAVTG